ncbi:MAG: MarR family transcriptional regulator [Nonomuraea sp.]|nr:MarR family transcriptional regulator [Nonomuraea sp.]NUP67643.1 MarR family transcriptional regulator [Nonomuraea sp.]NUR92301.1 MarR family transcriptional regulator [Nonomuraea sp.]NUS02479.1 MarR family transcriptional regulator [Nonomuraea sp.]
MSSRRLGYLLKHAALRLAELTGPALAPYGIDGRELAVLSVLDAAEPLSQQEAARRLGIDRTTMVAMVDTLEGKKLVARRPHPLDRRKNAVELTDRGRETIRLGVPAVERAEQAFLASVPEEEQRLFRAVLDRLV